MRTAEDGGTRAWDFLRRHPEYRAAWRAQAAQSAVEAAPFPVRIQSAADRQAAPWGLMAWEDPETDDGPASPFRAPMLDCELVAGARPLLAMLDAARARIEGLRLAPGGLVLKIERRAASAQVRIAAHGAFPEGA